MDKLTRNFFPLRELFLDGQLNLAEEPFFRQLIVTFIHHDLIKMKEKSRTRIPKQAARNLIGVVDEYGVLVSSIISLSNNPSTIFIGIR